MVSTLDWNVLDNFESRVGKFLGVVIFLRCFLLGMYYLYITYFLVTDRGVLKIGVVQSILLITGRKNVYSWKSLALALIFILVGSISIDF